jgi:hypothetical protein
MSSVSVAFRDSCGDIGCVIISNNGSVDLIKSAKEFLDDESDNNQEYDTLMSGELMFRFTQWLCKNMSKTARNDLFLGKDPTDDYPDNGCHVIDAMTKSTYKVIKWI